MAKYSKPKPRRLRRKKPARKGVRKTKSNFVKAVKAVISSTAETKNAYFSTGNSLTLYNSGIDSAADMGQVLPSITVGTADNQRIGDQLQGKSLNIKGFMRLTPKAATGTVTNEPKISNVVCRLMVLSLKQCSNYALATNQASQLSALLKKGGTTTGFTGLLSDIYSEVNTDLFTCHHNSIHYLSQDYVFVPSSTGGTYVNAPVAVDVRDTIKFFNINVKCKKVMKYDVTCDAGIRPTNYAPFLVMGYSYLSGDVPDVMSTQVGLQYITSFKYEDI